MRFFVLGNINAGKSTYVKSLINIMGKMGKYEVLRIDDFRKKYGKGSEKNEKSVAKQFAKAVLHAENAIVELCGFGYAAEEILKRLKSNSCIILYINTPLQLCLERIEAKRQTFVDNNHFAESSNIADTIRLLDTSFKNGKLKEMWWRVALGWHELGQNATLTKLPLRQYHYTGKIISILKDFGLKRLIAYGSLGRLDMGQHSDVDLILLSAMSPKQAFDLLYATLSETFRESNIFLLGEKIIILQDSMMFELAIVKTFKNYAKYYNGSYIKDVSKSILLGGKRLCDMINNATNLPKIESCNEAICKNKISYYFYFLQKMAKEEDRFRFYFYNNLIIDSITRYLCIKEGVTKYLYCPKHINDILAKYNINTLVCNMNEDKHTHIAKLKAFVARWIN